jgi:APA family basic amino acid/polyamine antiporter
MLNLTTLTWVRFLAWLLAGLLIYFSYGRQHSLVGRRESDVVGQAAGN